MSKRVSVKDGEPKLACAFCQETFGKLITSSRDHPRAYICDQCIRMCNWILEDDAAEEAGRAAEHSSQPPLDRLFVALRGWLSCEAAGGACESALDEVRKAALTIFTELPEKSFTS